MILSAALIGECMIELQEIEKGVTQQTFGGDTLNAAIYMARLKGLFPHRVDYVTALGTDDFSTRMIKFWEAEGVGSDLVLREPGQKPGLYYIQLDENGERSFSYWRSEAAAKKCFEFSGSEDVLKRLESYDLIYLSGISIAILTPTSRRRLFSRLQQLSGKGPKIYFDYNYRPHLWATPAEASKSYQELLEISDTVFVGLDELRDIHGTATVSEGQEYLARQGVEESIIRSGGSPCNIRFGKEHYEVSAVPLDEIVDTTAAGDSFSGAYMVARMAGCSPEQAAKMAHRMAAYVIQHKGAIAPLAAMPDFTDFLKS